IAPVAPGLRAMPSAAPATALPWPRAHNPEAMAMPMAANGPIQLAPPELAAVVSAANAGIADNINASERNVILFFIRMTPCGFELEFRRWLRSTPGGGRPHAEA